MYQFYVTEIRSATRTCVTRVRNAWSININIRVRARCQNADDDAMMLMSVRASGCPHPQTTQRRTRLGVWACEYRLGIPSVWVFGAGGTRERCDDELDN